MLTPALLLTLLFCLLASSFPELTSAYPRHHRYRRFNISSFIYPLHFDNTPKEDFKYSPSPPPPFLKDVVNAIKKKEKWDSEEEFMITKLDLTNSRIGDSRRYEFRIGTGEDELVFRTTDLVSPWKRLSVTEESDFEAVVKESSSNAILDSFEIQGPYHLSVIGDHNLTLSLPVDASFSGLKHVLVGEGITLKISGASEVSLLHVKRTPNFVDQRLLGYVKPSLCMAQLHLRLLGSVTLVAYRTQRPKASIKTRYLSKRTLELLSAKCYSVYAYRKPASSINSVQSKIPLFGNIIRRFIGQKTNQALLGSESLHAKIIASSMFRFKLEFQRENQNKDSKWNTVAEWRTKPGIERLCFNVIARADGDMLKLVQANKLKPIDEVGLRYYINLKTNISFTKFPALILPQKSLTLDVNW